MKTWTYILQVIYIKPHHQILARQTISLGIISLTPHDQQTFNPTRTRTQLAKNKVPQASICPIPSTTITLQHSDGPCKPTGTQPNEWKDEKIHRRYVDWFRLKIPVTRSRRNLQERDGKNSGSCRNTPEVIETWKQYSGRKTSGFFPVTSDQFLAGNHRKVIGMHRKKYRNFPVRILLPCFGDFRCIPAATVPYSLTWGTTENPL